MTRVALQLCALLASFGASFAQAQPATRSYALGFTDFPYAGTPEAVAWTANTVETEGDLAVFHFDNGIPWTQALADTAYPTALQAELDAKAASIPPGHHVYLAITPLNFARDGLAPAWDSSAPPVGWENHPLDHPDVVAAFQNHALRMIELFSPDWFAYTIEGNLLVSNDVAKWPAYLSLANQVYDAVKAAHPTLATFVSIQADAFATDASGHSAALAPLLDDTDVMGVSSYAFVPSGDPDTVAADRLLAVANLAPEKPFAVAETGWPAEDLTAPFPFAIPATPANQADWVERTLADADAREALFVVWFVSRDYDDFWTSHFQFDPAASVLRAWRDNGLFAGDGSERPGLGVWRAAAARTYVPEPNGGTLTLAAFAALLGLRARSRRR